MEVKRYRYKTGLGLCLALVISLAPGCSGADPAGYAWLQGTWELTFNPQNDDADVLTFNSDGTVTIRTVDGRDVSGRYAVLDRQVALTLVTNQKIVDVRFDVAPDRTRLIYENGAYYTRKP